MSQHTSLRSILLVGSLLVAGVASAQTQTTKPFEPTVGQAGKDVVWVPTPDALVEKMLDLAKLTPQDVLMDLGSGDGRTVIAAAKRGSRAVGIEFNPDMVALARKNAEAAKVSDKATIEQGDLYEADLNRAQVITMFLLPSINMKLRPKILDLKPGTRIVTNSFTMEDWTADETANVTENCSSWCQALLWIVPAKVDGSWQLGQAELKLTQQFQMLTGALGSASLTDGRLRGTEISFTVGGTKYTGTVAGNTMKGTSSAGGSWTATKK
ncbi:MAG: class I SAM-dependent methyltransferase [Acidobacteria bacterium]|nr:class I SAM-dependent methyltransferase [Acidobacteriota bacterium]